MSAPEPMAVILEIMRMSTEDGPGLRTTVFFKGCGLRCAWCHNPESISPKPQTQWIGSRCIACRLCIDKCENEALTYSEGGIAIDRDACKGCGECACECPSTAMELMGKRWSVAELADEVAKDKAYFDKSGGGVTLSGGEAALQAEFAAAFMKNLRERGIATALDTCGQCASSALEMLIPLADLVMFDIKEIDTARHREFTGAGNERILENLICTANWIRTQSIRKSLWIRTPIIPHATDREENIRGIGAFIAANLGGAVSRWELCSFNNLCRDKYARLGRKWEYAGRELITREEMETLAVHAKKSGVDPKIVHWSGMTRLVEQAGKSSDSAPRPPKTGAAC
jgi:pyruvate formate lyase activating enzyme